MELSFLNKTAKLLKNNRISEGSINFESSDIKNCFEEYKVVTDSTAHAETAEASRAPTPSRWVATRAGAPLATTGTTQAVT